jgi:endo-1,4-beta-xylanase
MGTVWTGGMQYCSDSQASAGNGYTAQLYFGTGSGCMIVAGGDARFSANWNNPDDFLARVGLKFPGTQSYSAIGTISSDLSFTTSSATGGSGYMGIYGWSVSPVHEYYIVEDWLGSAFVPSGTHEGTIVVDGGNYDVYAQTLTNQPVITGGNATYVRFWSVRQAPRLCGHVSISTHFSQWATLGLQLGNMEEATVFVEAINNPSGSVDFTTATVVVGP